MRKNRTMILKTAVVISIILLTSAVAKKQRMLVHMIPRQYDYFVNKIVEPFALKEGVKIEVINTPEMDEIPWVLKMNPDRFTLVKIPFTYARMLVDSGYIKSLDSFLPSEELTKFKKEYLLTFFGRKNRKQYLLPRKFETRILVHRMAPVEEARKQLKYYKDSLNIVLKEMNGFGIPPNFVLEQDPDLWNDYDIFVLGWIWARLEFEDGVKPRIGFRSKNYSGTALRVIDRVLQMGGDSISIMSMNTPEVADAFFWEAALSYTGVLNKDMVEGEWDGKRIWQAFRDDGLFLSYLTQLDAFSIIGADKDSTDKYIDSTEDLAFNLMPSGASLSINEKGIRERIGTHSVNTGGWWWGIPSASKSFEFGYKLYKHITKTKIVENESLKFGMIPIKTELVNSKKLLLNSGVRSKILQASYRQLKQNGNNLIPAHRSFAAISELYLQAWNDIVKGKNWSMSKGGAPNYDYIESVIRKKYAAKAVVMINRKLNMSSKEMEYEAKTIEERVSSKSSKTDTSKIIDTANQNSESLEETELNTSNMIITNQPNSSSDSTSKKLQRAEDKKW